MYLLQYQDEFISEENIDNNINLLWGALIPILEHRKYLYDRYTRKLDNSTLKVPLEYYISNIASGYFGGKEPQFKVKQMNETKKAIIEKVFNKSYDDKNNTEEYQTLIDYITAYNDNAEFFYDVVKDYINTGGGYGLLYENTDNETVYAWTSALNTCAIWNYETPAQKIGLIRYWFENYQDGIQIHLELITKTYRRHYVNNTIQNIVFDKGGKQDFKQVESDLVLWDDLPCFAVENPDELALFENVITLIQKYEQVCKNNANTFQYNDEAKLKVTGFTPENELLVPQKDKNGNVVLDADGNPIMIENPLRVKEDSAILNAPVFYTPDNTGDIDWITKNINDTASENHKKTMLDMALMVAGVPNVTDTGFTNADNSSALEKKFFPLDQVLQQADKLFKKEFLRLWEMITHRINLKKGTEYDFRDIEIILNKNLPTNNREIVENWLKLRGLISDKTVIDHLPYDLDSESELLSMDEQNAENMQRNLENLRALGGDKSDVGRTEQTDGEVEEEIPSGNENNESEAAGEI